MKVRGKKISVRFPLPPKVGGAMKVKKGGYNRERDRKQAVREGMEELLPEATELFTEDEPCSTAEAHNIPAGEENSLHEGDPWLEAEWDDINRDRYAYEEEGE